MITFKLPTQLRAMADGCKTIEVEAATLAEAFRRMDERAPMLRPQIFDEAGKLRAFVGVFVNSEHVTALDDGSRVLPPGSQIVIIMAIAGG